MILFVSRNDKEVDTAINLSKVISIEKVNYISADNSVFMIRIRFDLCDDYYELRFGNKEERDNKFDEYITAWEMALKGDCNHD